MAKILINSEGCNPITTNLELKTLQKEVGGYIELVRLGKNRVMIIDEEGRLKNKPANPCASLMVNLDGPLNYIVGDAILLTGYEARKFLEEEE